MIKPLKDSIENFISNHDLISYEELFENFNDHIKEVIREPVDSKQAYDFLGEVMADVLQLSLKGYENVSIQLSDYFIKKAINHRLSKETKYLQKLAKFCKNTANMALNDIEDYRLARRYLGQALLNYHLIDTNDIYESKEELRLLYADISDLFFAFNDHKRFIAFKEEIARLANIESGEEVFDKDSPCYLYINEMICNAYFNLGMKKEHQVYVNKCIELTKYDDELIKNTYLAYSILNFQGTLKNKEKDELILSLVSASKKYLATIETSEYEINDLIHFYRTLNVANRLGLDFDNTYLIKAYLTFLSHKEICPLAYYSILRGLISHAYDTNNNEEALNYLYKAINLEKDLYEKSFNIYDLKKVASIDFEIANIYDKLNARDNANAFYEEGIKNYNEVLNATFDQNVIFELIKMYCKLAENQHGFGQYEKAKKNYVLCLEYYKLIYDKSELYKVNSYKDLALKHLKEIMGK